MSGKPGQLKISGPPAEDAVDPDVFRSIMSAFPSGVTVVTTLDHTGRPLGLTCSAACSVSLSPPLLLACIHRESHVLQAITADGRFIVNFLRDSREWISSLFASKQADRFRSVSWQPSRQSGLPWLPVDTIAFADCRVAGVIEAGDHTIVIGAVVDGHAAGSSAGPLMYWRRQYGHWPAGEDLVSAALTLATEG